MPSLLEPDQPIDSGLLGPPPRITPPDPGNVDWADAVSTLQQAIEAQRANSAQMGLWDEQTGLPTAKGLVNAADQYGQGMLFGTVAPGVRGGAVPKMQRETIPIKAGTDMRVNPSVPELQRMLENNQGGLRIIRNGENIAVAPGYDTFHNQMLMTLRDSAHPLGDFKNDAWIAYPNKQIVDANADFKPVKTEDWPLSLRSLFTTAPQQ